MPRPFADLIEIATVRPLMESFARTSGLPMAIVDRDGKVLLHSGWQRLCLLFHRAHPATLTRCLESDTDYSSFSPQGEPPAAGSWHESRCRNGLVHIGLPIVIGGEQMATLFLSQFFYETPDKRPFEQQAREYGFDEEAYLEAVEQVPVIPREKVRDVLGFYSGFVQLLAAMGDARQRQLEARAQLEASEQKFRTIFENAYDSIVIMSVNGRLLEANRQTLLNLGYGREELLGRHKKEIHAPEEAEGIERFISQVREQECAVRESVQLRKDGGRFPVEISSRLIDYEGRPAILCITRDLTERKKAEEALRESEERFRTIFHNAAIGMATLLPGGRFGQVNPSFCRFLGYEPEELLQRTVEEITHPDDREISREVIGEAQRSGDPVFHLEKRYRRKDGTPVWGHLTGIWLKGPDGRLQYGIAQIQDISQRKAAEESLRLALAETEASRDKISAILESVSDGLIVTDLSDRVVLMNKAAETLLGLSLPGTDRRIGSILPNPDLRRQIALARETADGTAPAEWEQRPSGRGEPRTLQARTRGVHRADGTLWCTITLLRDITRERAIDRMKDEFISTAAHELRTPLASITGYLELLLKKEEFAFSPEDQDEFLQIAYRQSEVLAWLIEDLLDLSRVQSGHLVTLSRSPQNIFSLVGQAVEAYRRVSPWHTFSLTFPRPDIRLVVDPGKLGQVLENLLSNAVKFSPEGGRITLSGIPEDGMFHIAVQDEGIGMTPDQVERIFDKFYRVDVSNTAASGLGLGMSIVRNIVEAHGGRIWVESEPGRGTTVHFTLPMKQEGPTSPAESRAAEARSRTNRRE